MYPRGYNNGLKVQLCTLNTFSLQELVHLYVFITCFKTEQLNTKPAVKTKRVSQYNLKIYDLIEYGDKRDTTPVTVHYLFS